MRNIFLPLVLEVVLVTACERDFLSIAHNHDHDLKPRSPSSIFRRAAPFPPVLSTPETILTNSFDNVSLDTWSSYYAHGAHIAGTNKTMAQWTSDRWNENGISSKLVEYEVFLNYPVSASVKLETGNGSHEAQLWEDRLLQDDTTTYPNAIPAFHGYSFTGDAKAEYIYVGYVFTSD
jgi:N-acetylated-alpha-linked acidic dipeptidase